ncbi:substrate-binding domain-containing protein [Umezawaea sp. NPDC059074]|uniref:substrate-binding domain-containing protein n=1 Tax=Umezawaea sp. NPDC059074 TaxID=3346716 RepID=UPI0036CD7761
MREPSGARRQRILGVVGSRGAVRVSELAAELEVSVVTVRRDVEEMARAGVVRRGHGVVRPVGVAERHVAEPVAGGAVALVVPERHTYLYEAVHGARVVLEEAGLRVALHIAPQVVGAERPIVERALAEGARGVLLAPRWRSADAEAADHGWLARIGVPVVLVERRPAAGSAAHAVDSVCSDHWYGAHLAVDHLVGLGHRRILLAARDDSPTARALRRAFAEIVAARPEVDDWGVVLSAPDAGPGPGAEAVAGFADQVRERGITGVVLHGDVEALMLVQELAAHGVRVPEDCSVVAYDDVVAGMGGTPLTAVAPPKAEVGKVAAEVLLRRLAGERDVRRVELLPTLTVRGSTMSV